jgi:periplasmic protein TonB
MFEDSLVESCVTPISRTRQWTMATSTVLQAAVAAILVAIPLLHPERLSFHADAPLVFTPPPPRTPILVTQPVHAAEAGSSATLPTAPQPIVRTLTQDSGPAADEPPVLNPFNNMNPTTGIPDALRTWSGSGPAVSATPPRPPAERMQVSKGVLAGMLLSPIRPVYPAIARAAGVSGSVVVEAVISKTGTIESLHVITGPEMLRIAALDAIRAARYQPFRLNGEPIEVQTTITVNFRLGT